MTTDIDDFFTQLFASADRYNEEKQEIIDAIEALAPRDILVRDTANIVGDCVRRMLGNKQTLDEIEKAQKTHLGTFIEKDFLEHFNFHINTRASKLITGKVPDTIIAGYPVDVKVSLWRNWMIPPESMGIWLLLFAVDFDQRTFDMGVIRADIQYMGLKRNKDEKRSLRKTAKRGYPSGHDKIHWIISKAPFVVPDFSHWSASKSRVEQMLQMDLNTIEGNEAFIRHISRLKQSGAWDSV